jgi:8-oxoguanine deaminase
MSTLLAKNADILVTMDDGRRELANAGLFVRDGIIEQVGPSGELPRDADVVLDITGQVILPGFVNTHHHLDQTLTRALPHGQNINLFPWLRAHYEIWARRTPEASRLCTLVGLAELAASGCTTVFDHTYIFKNGSRLDDQISAAREIGALCRWANPWADCRQTAASRTKRQSSMTLSG